MNEKHVLLALSLLSLSACMPIPRYERVAPEIIGSVQGGSSPTILVCEPHYRLNCDQYHRVATSADGKFHLEGQDDLWLFVALGDSVFEWGFDVENNGATYVGYRGHDIAIVPERIELVCDLNGAAPKNQANAGVICRETSNNSLQARRP